MYSQEARGGYSLAISGNKPGERKISNLGNGIEYRIRQKCQCWLLIKPGEQPVQIEQEGEGLLKGHGQADNESYQIT